ncbi:MAG: PKD domain-containing protein [Nitrososphaeraceae archaeon]
MKKTLFALSLLLPLSAFAVNQFPIAVANGNPLTGTAPLTVQFSSTGTHDPDGYITNVGWNFGDGTQHSPMPHPTHVYSNPGVYTVTFSAFDNLGARSQTQKTVNVSGNTPPATKVGFIGCSMSMNAVHGTYTLDPTLFWSTLPQYGGGGLAQWIPSPTNMYWDKFQTAYTNSPTNVIWWQLCSVDSTSAQQTFANAQLILNEINDRVPNAQIYVSAQPAYYNPTTHVCTNAGVNGVSTMQTIAGQLVNMSSTDNVYAGPVVGPLDATNQLVDTCHANGDGEEMMGQQLIDADLLN